MKRTMLAAALALAAPAHISAQTDPGWQEVARMTVNDRADWDLALVGGDAKYRVVKVCAEREAIRIKRADVRLEGTLQRLFLPLVLKPGECSKEIKLQGAPAKIRFFMFDYEAWSAGMARGTITIQALGITPR